MTTIAILQIITIVLIVAALFIWQRNRFIIDAGRIADLMAAQLLAEYEGGLFILDSDGVKSYARHKYMQMVTEWGLPSAAVGRVEILVNERVKLAQGHTEPETAVQVPIYE